MEKINPRWEYGIFVGIRTRSNEVILAPRDGIHFARSVRRIPREERWSDDNVEWVQWAPWHQYRGDEYADGSVPESTTPGERGSAESSSITCMNCGWCKFRDLLPLLGSRAVTLFVKGSLYRAYVQTNAVWQ